jgi:hypothetical protein
MIKVTNFNGSIVLQPENDMDRSVLLRFFWLGLKEQTKRRNQSIGTVTDSCSTHKIGASLNDCFMTLKPHFCND